MATRTVPPPRIVYERTSEVAHYQITTKDSDRKALALLREQEARGEVEIDAITMPPQIDMKGNAHVTAFFWRKRLMTEDEIDRVEKKQLEQINKAAQAGGGGQRSSGPPPGPLAGITLTQEERDALAPYRGARDDD